MGRLFLREFSHPGDFDRYVNCKVCGTPIDSDNPTNVNDRIWLAEVAEHVHLRLLGKLINVNLEKQPGDNLDEVHCIKCNAKLGWIISRLDLHRPGGKVFVYALRQRWNQLLVWTNDIMALVIDLLQEEM